MENIIGNTLDNIIQDEANYSMHNAHSQRSDGDIEEETPMYDTKGLEISIWDDVFEMEFEHDDMTQLVIAKAENWMEAMDAWSDWELIKLSYWEQGQYISLNEPKWVLDREDVSR